jgi:hypothetical protein
MKSAVETPLAGGEVLPRGARQEVTGRRSWSMGRDVVTPGTAVLFVVSTVTGIMLLLHWQSGLVHTSHEWLSVVFSAIAIWHLVKNWRAFSLYLKRNVPLVAIALTLVASLAFTAATARGPGGNPQAIIGTIAAQPLSAVAPAMGLDQARAVALLREAGIDATDHESLAAIAGRSGRSVFELAGMLAGAAPR